MQETQHLPQSVILDDMSDTDTLQSIHMGDLGQIVLDFAVFVDGSGEICFFGCKGTLDCDCERDATDKGA